MRVTFTFERYVYGERSCLRATLLLPRVDMTRRRLFDVTRVG